MPTVLRKHGFEVRIRLSPREHGPPHVHVHKAGGMAIVSLPEGDQSLAIRRVRDMRDADVVKALWIVETHEDHLMAAWRRLHGSS